METGLIISAIFLVLVSAISKAIMDLSEESKIKGNPLFWHKNKSWQNKWKNGDKTQGEKFWLSSTFFVAQTDAWHLFGVLFRTTFAKAYICVGLLISINIWYAFASIVVYIIFATTFHIFYTYKIFRK